MKLLSAAMAATLCLFACQKAKTEKTTHSNPGSSSSTEEDKNGDGVRDDVGGFLDSLQVKSSVDAALKQYARAFKYIMEAKGEDEAIKAAEQLVEAIQCLYAQEPDLDRADELKAKLQARILDTEERLNIYYRVTRLLSGHSFEHRPLNDKINACVVR